MEANNPKEPQWDVALEALLVQTYQSSKSRLGLDSLQALASKYTIRLDDILDTLCILSERNVWTYYDTDGNAAKPDRDMSRLLHANKRLNTGQLERFAGTWSPVA